MKYVKGDLVFLKSLKTTYITSQYISETEQLFCNVKVVCDSVVVTSVDTGGTQMWIITCSIQTGSPYLFSVLGENVLNKTV